MNKEIRVLVVGSAFSVKGGIATVIKQHMLFNWDGVVLKHLVTFNGGNFFKKLFVFLKSIICLPFILLLSRIDIVHVHMSMRGSYYRKRIIISICRFFRKKVVVHHHGSEIFNFYDQLSKRGKRKFIKIFSNVNMNIVLSKKIQTEFYNISSSIKTFVLYNSTQIYNNFIYNPSGHIIMFLGKICKRKGAYDLIDAIKILDRKIDSHFIFYFCGDGETEEIKKKIDALFLNKRCVVYGWISEEEEKNKLFSDVVLNVLPSYNEGLPMSLLEMMGRGIPCVSTRIASIPELIDDSNGELIEPGDVLSLANSIESFLLSTREYKLSKSNSAFRTIKEKFNQNKNMEILLNLWKELLL